MFFGLTIEKVLVIAVIAGLLIGPERLPKYAQMLARLTVRGRDFMRGATTRMKEEMGPDFDEADWRRLDPRQYDPRRIIREALLEEPPVAAAAASGSSTAAAAVPSVTVRYDAASGELPPFDNEAT